MAEKSAIRNPPSANVSILLVDDLPENLLALEATLGDMGVNLVKAQSGREALRHCLENEFAVILLDIHMPGMDGFETADLLLQHERSHATPIVFMTATYQDDEHMLKGYSAGAVDYLIKPVVSQVLRSKVAVFVELFKTQQQLRHLNETLEQRVAERTAELEQALNDLQRAQSKIIEQERLTALGTMASGIAHDFNNALAPLLGFSELLLRRPENLDDRPKVIRYLELMNSGAKDAAHVVARLRQFYRQREEGEVFLPVKLNEVVEQAISLTQPKWKDQAQARGVTVNVQCRFQAIPLIAGNESELREVLTNLIFNAVDALADDGEIVLRTLQEGDRIVLQVSDTGTGMTEEVRRRCLEPFFSTKGERGTGLGLPMVYGIVRRHNGTMAVESEWGKGTTFSLRFPVAGHTVETAVIEGALTRLRPVLMTAMVVRIARIAKEQHTPSTLFPLKALDDEK